MGSQQSCCAGQDEVQVENITSLQHRKSFLRLGLPLSNCLLMVLTFVSISLDTKTGVTMAQVPPSAQLLGLGSRSSD